MINNNMNKKNKRIRLGFFVLAIVVILIGTVSATMDNSGVYKQNEDIYICQVCADATYINISSISSPTSEILIDNQEMSYTGTGQYCYNFTGINTDQLGRYDVRGISDGCENTFAFYFDVTSSGESFKDSQGIMILGEGLMIILFLGLAFSFDKRKWKLRAFFIMISLFFGVLILNSLQVIAGGSSTLAAMANLALIIGIIIISFMFLYILINYLVELFHYFKKKNRTKWGIEEDF